MAIVDALNRVCDAQAFTAVAVSTDAIDLGAVSPRRDIGSGEPIAALITVDVAASSTTVLFEHIMATDAALTAGIIVQSQRTFLSADMPAGRKIVFPLPAGVTAAGPLRYLGCRVTPAGGAATVTLTVDYGPQSHFNATTVHYADAITV